MVPISRTHPVLIHGDDHHTPGIHLENQHLHFPLMGTQLSIADDTIDNETLGAWPTAQSTCIHEM
ncbi:MAG: hypothetical protein RJA15_994 [Actinomycetota bacterium]